MPVLLLACLGLAAAPLTRTISTKDGERRYLLLKPDAKERLPLVLLLHGHGGSARQALRIGPLAAWAAISPRDRVLVAALDGMRGPDGKQGWNDCRDAPAVLPSTDDVAFAKAVVEQLVREDRADPARVYVMGMSNGAMMALRLALQLTPAPAAVAVACGLLAEGGACASSPGRAVSALLIEGTKDPLVPFSGGRLGMPRESRGVVLSADRTVSFFLASNGLGSTRSIESAFPHLHTSDSTRAFKSVWGSDDGPQVEFVRVEGGGHAEPTLDHPYGAVYRLVTGNQNHDLESAEEAWAFFRPKRSR